MMENMIGVVGCAMHEDRLAKAAQNMRLADVKHGRQGSLDAVPKRYRAGIAAALISLAARLTPAIAATGDMPR